MFSFTTLNPDWVKEIMVLNPVDLAKDFSKGKSVQDLIGKTLCAYCDSDYAIVEWIIWSHLGDWSKYDVETFHIDYGSSKMVLFKFYEIKY
jgi:hypothetical protein